MKRCEWMFCWLCLAAPALAQQIAGCQVFPKTNIWNTPIDSLPIDRASARYIEAIGIDRNLHPDFGPTGGIPINVVPANQPKVTVQFDSEDSDPGPYPLPANPAIESGEDNHILIIQQGDCRLYEIFAASKTADGQWHGGSGAIFELRSNGLRPDGWTSADAAGLPIAAGLVRYDEIEAGEIRHALRMTVPRTRREYVWPARHFASQTTEAQYPPMGQRFRLKASFDIDSFPPEVRVVLRALKKYGMILADNGSPWFLTGASDARWNTDVWNALKQVKGSDLEAVDASSLMISPSSGIAGSPVVVGRQSIAYSESPAIDLSGGGTISMVLNGNVPYPHFFNLTDGLQLSVLICQDATGGWQFTWPEYVQGGMTISLQPAECSAQQFVSDGKTLWATSAGVTRMRRPLQ